MRNRIEKYNGHTYEIEYRPELSEPFFYTRKRVYYIKSDNESYPKAHRDIIDIMNDGSWTKAKRELELKKSSTFSAALHDYHEFDYDEVLDVYIYTHIIPYDD
jgi:hypothetical protein